MIKKNKILDKINIYKNYFKYLFKNYNKIKNIKTNKK